LRKRREAASREARTLELKRANEAINKGKEAIAGDDYNPFAEEERRPTPSAPSKAGVEKAKVSPTMNISRVNLVGSVTELTSI
jgi:hypothetical protein